MAEMQRERRVELALGQLEQLPTLPAVALKIVQVTSSDQSSAKEVIKLIESDPSLTTRILQLVHRSDAGVRSEINSVERAVVLLGFETVRSAVLAVSIFQTFPSDGQGQTSDEGSGFNREGFWKHAVAVATAAELLTAQIPGKNRVDACTAFICGLLHDLGKVALDAALPRSYAKVIEAVELLRGNVADVERQVIGLDHMVAGKRLAEKWQLPALMRECIWLHGQHPAALPPGVRQPELVNLITLADVAAREMHLGYSGNHLYPVSRQVLLEALGLSQDAYAKATSKLVECLELRAKDMGLDSRSSGELYQQAISQANKELGRVTSQLAAKNRRLAIRAKFFDALAAFHGELRPDAPTTVVMQAIAQTATGLLESGVAVFSLSSPGDYADICLVDAQGNVQHEMLAECPIRPAVPTLSSDVPAAIAGDSLEWLLGVMGPHLSGGQRYWICLETDGQCVGGVVWGGAGTTELERLIPQKSELSAIASGWALALRTAQIRQEARELSEQLAETNRRLQGLQNQVLRQKTLVTVGEMAAGAAHELNNPLAVIGGRSQLLAATLTDPKQKAAAQLIAEQAERLSEIITELMIFAKPQPPKPALTSVQDIIKSAMEKVLSNASAVGGRKIEFQEHSASVAASNHGLTSAGAVHVPLVFVDAQQVCDALTEVLNNAVQATDDHLGHISVSVVFDPYGRNAVISVVDNGRGMDEATLRRAFDPFFSAKSAGRRRGMGLAKAVRWIEGTGGSIRLESQPDQGTRALILLPVGEGQKTLIQEESSAAA